MPQAAATSQRPDGREFMNTQPKETAEPQQEAPKKGFFGSLIARIDRAMKEAAEKKASRCCCCAPGDKQDKDGKCC